MTDERIIIPSGLTRWFTAFADDVMSGRVSLEELLEVADSDMQQSGQQLCPTCARRVIRPGTVAQRYGICSVCHLQRLRDAHLERLAEVEAQRDLNAAKQQVSRARRRLGVLPDHVRESRDYTGRVPLSEYEPPSEPLPVSIREASRERYGGRRIHDTDEPTPLVTCATCGTQYRDHGDDAPCPECEERRERRTAARTSGRE